LSFRTVFDIAAEGFRGWEDPAAIVAIILVAILVTWRLKIFENRRGGTWVLFVSLLMCGLAVVAGCLNWRDFVAARNAFLRGHFEIAEGLVTAFKAALPPNAGHGEQLVERFAVNGIPFSYSEEGGAPGFHKTKILGGPIHEGEYVRISYVRNTILKLEIGQ
jgi:hypothetical protein